MKTWVPAFLLAVLASSLAAAPDLAFKKEGKGPGIVLIHGFGGSRDAWTEMSKRLKTSHTVISVDLPGHGDSTPPPIKDGAADLDAIGIEIAKLIRKQKIEPVILIGHSLGGGVAVRVALADPTAVRGILLVDSRLAPLPKAFTDKLRKDLDANASAALNEFMGSLCNDGTQRARLVKDALKVPLPVLKAYAEALSTEPLGGRVAAIKVPVMLFASPLLIPEPAEEKDMLKILGMDGIPKFKVSYFVNVSHWIMWDDPDTFEILFNDFETSLVTGSSGAGSKVSSQTP